MENKMIEMLELIILKLDKLQARIDMLESKPLKSNATSNMAPNDIKSQISQMRSDILNKYTSNMEFNDSVAKTQIDEARKQIMNSRKTSPIIKPR